MRSRSISTLAIAAALLVGACGGPETPATTPTVVELTSTTSTSTTSNAAGTRPAELSTTTSTINPTSGPIVIAEDAGQIGVQIGGKPTAFSLNPFVAQGWSLLVELDPLLFAGAWKPGSDGEPLPDLVEALPHPDDGTAVVNPDGTLELTYRVRTDARWDDGTAVTSSDFALTLEILQDPDIPIVSRLRDPHAGLTDFQAISDAQFTLTMDPPYTMYRQLFPIVIPAPVVEPGTFAEEWTETLWPSAGPMRLVSFERFAKPLAGVMVLEPNPVHREAPEEALRIDFYQRDERGDSLAIDAFLNGEADILGSQAFTPRNFDRISAIASIASSASEIWEVLYLQPGTQRLEVNPESRLDEVSVRYAIAAALLVPSADLPGDRITSLVEFFMPGVVNPHGGWRGPWSLLPRPTDPIPLVYESTNGELTMQIGRAVEPLLEAAGFDVELRFPDDFQTAIAGWSEGRFEIFATREFHRPGAEALFELFDTLAGNGAEGFHEVWPDSKSRQTFQGILDDFTIELDPEVRIGHLLAAEQALVDAMIVIPLVTRRGQPWAYHPDRVVGPAGSDERVFIFGLTEWRRP